MNPSLESCLPPLYRFALSLTRDVHSAEDLAHDTMVRACERCDQLQSPGALRSWLFQIAANLWRDRLRSQARGPRITVAVAETAWTAEPDPLSLQDDVAATLQVLRSLPEQQRAVMHLYAVEDLTLPEIADILDVRTETARVHLCLARRTLRQRLPHLWNELKSPDQS